MREASNNEAQEETSDRMRGDEERAQGSKKQGLTRRAKPTNERNDRRRDAGGSHDGLDVRNGCTRQKGLPRVSRRSNNNSASSENNEPRVGERGISASTDGRRRRRRQQQQQTFLHLLRLTTTW